MIKFSIAKPCARYLENNKRNLTDSEIAEATGLSRQAVKNARTGVLRIVDLDKMQTILTYFRSLGISVTLFDLLTEEEGE
jgi:hypothetical protein